MSDLNFWLCWITLTILGHRLEFLICWETWTNAPLLQSKCWRMCVYHCSFLATIRTASVRGGTLSLVIQKCFSVLKTEAVFILMSNMKQKANVSRIVSIAAEERGQPLCVCWGLLFFFSSRILVPGQDPAESDRAGWIAGAVKLVWQQFLFSCCFHLLFLLVFSALPFLSCRLREQPQRNYSFTWSFSFPMRQRVKWWARAKLNNLVPWKTCTVYEGQAVSVLK